MQAITATPEAQAYVCGPEYLHLKEAETKESTQRGLRTANFDGRLKFEQVGLPHENISRCQTELTHFVLCELHLLAWTSVPARKQSGDDFVQHNIILHRTMLPT
jgi:hypothetical protein